MRRLVIFAAAASSATAASTSALAENRAPDRNSRSVCNRKV
jgi:hypothetical protein